MIYRRLGKTGMIISEVSFGAWAIGGSWGKVDEQDAIAALEHALDQGVNFIDTADVYGDGRSERLIKQVLKNRNEPVYVATKFGRRSHPHTAASYNQDNLRKYLERSLKNLGLDTIDLIQLHCPPSEVYYQPEVFEILDEFKQEGLIENYGVSVEKVEEGLKAIEYPGVSSVQIIYNMFRQRPANLFMREAMKKDVGVICRVPLASGLLTGKFSKQSKFEQDDHRNFNRSGEAFDRGETFAGVPFEVGVEVAEKLADIKPDGITMTQFALKWILQRRSSVSCAIVGCKNTQQVKENFAASDGMPLSQEVMDQVEEIYKQNVKPYVHQLW